MGSGSGTNRLRPGVVEPMTSAPLPLVLTRVDGGPHVAALPDVQSRRLPRRPLRTGVIALEPAPSRAAWLDRVRRLDDQGHDVLLTPDHLGLWPPFSPVVAAAEASDRLRFGTLVLNNEFWNPVLLAREVAAVDVLTDGRIELGMGAGHAEVEFAASGIPYDPPGARVARLGEAVALVRRLLAGEQLEPS